jgi:drug/metabolite transporter (DMT)-like permease
MEYLIGFLFALLWASGSLATKIGVGSADPLSLALMRFVLAGSVLFVYNYLVKRSNPLPKGEQWLKIIVFGFFGTTVYSGCYFVATISTSVGLLNLFVAINPLLIVFLSSIWLKKSISKNQVVGFIICFLGLATATYPSLVGSCDTLFGIAVLSLGMLSYSFANVYYGQMNLPLSNVTINTWQVIFGGLMLVPFAIFWPNKYLILDYNLAFSVLFLGIVISVFTTLLWYALLKKDAIKASQWLYLSPILGYGLSYFFLHEAITQFAIIGTILVIFGLRVSRRA